MAVTAPESGIARAWHLRVHLRVGQRVASATLGGGANTETGVALNVKHLTAPSVPHFPFGGVGSGPAANAGPIAEVVIESSVEPRMVELVIV